MNIHHKIPVLVTDLCSDRKSKTKKVGRESDVYRRGKGIIVQVNNKVKSNEKKSCLRLTKIKGNLES